MPQGGDSIPPSPWQYSLSTPSEISSEILKVRFKWGYENKFQHLIETQHNELLKLLQTFEDLFGKTLGTYKTDPLTP